MSSSKLAEALIAFDDEALATLANAGLLRRAQRDLDKGKVEITNAGEGQATVEVDGHTVTIGADGPAKASCTCPAAGVCRHRIAATLVLREGGGDPDEAPADEPPAADDPPADPAVWIDAITLDHARKFAGKPGFRAALELAEEASKIDATDTRCSITFASLDEPVLILRGQGMAGIVSKASKARQKAYHAAALLAARRHFGLAAETTEDEALAPAAPVSKGTPTAPDAQFLEAVRAALADCAELGFNLAPLPIEERLFELSVSSRADALPRLSALLRSVAAQMRLRRAKSFEFEASTMLELAATAYAITFAVSREGLELPAFLRLAGELRRNYADATTLDLIGCGADQWRSGSGARGVTAHFVEPDTGEFYSVAIARGAGQDPDFHPASAFRNQALWQAGTMEALSHARLTLENAGIADGGRLASSKDVRARILEKAIAPDPQADYVHADWMALQANLAGRFGLGVDANGQPQMALIQPAEVARPQFDELAQRLTWPIRDAEGRWIALSMDHDERSESAIAEIEKQLAKKWSGTMLVRAFQSGTRMELTPVTLFDGAKPVDLTLVQREWDWRGILGESKRAKPDIFGWLQTLRPDPGRALTFVQPPASAAAVMDAWRYLLDRLEAGPKLAKQLDDKRAAHERRLADYGMTSLAERVGKANHGAELLSAAYAVLIARQQRVSLAFLG